MTRLSGCLLVAALVGLAVIPARAAGAEPVAWRGQTIDEAVGRVCYAVATADVDGDSRLDIVAVANDAVVWYRNPTWEKQDILRGGTEPDNVCLQPHDVDGDGRIDFALGSAWRPTDTQTGGNLGILTRTGAPEGAWRLVPIGSEPTLHRVRWGRVLDRDRKAGPRGLQLVVAPLQGRGTRGPDWGAGDGSRLSVWSIPPRPFDEPWPNFVLNDQMHTIHNIAIVANNWLAPGVVQPIPEIPAWDAILAASWEGVFLFQWHPPGEGWRRYHLGAGDQASRPNRGTSEVRAGRQRDGQPFLAAIEPWHGHQVVVYYPRPAADGPPPLMARTVIDETLAWGHAVACADVDRDGADDILVGQRDPNPKAPPGQRDSGVLVYYQRPATAPTLPPSFSRTQVDPGGVAVEDLIVADLDGDGRPDLVAGGRATHNVKVYWNGGPPPP